MRVLVARIRSSDRAQGVVVLGLALLFALIAWFLVISPSRARTSTLGGQVTAAEVDLDTQRSRVGAAASAASVASLTRALPRSADYPGLILQLNRLATLSGVSLESITPGTSAPGATYETLPMTIVVDGRYFSVRNFLQRLRRQVRFGQRGIRASGRLFTVESVDLAQSDPAPRLHASLALSAYVFAATAPAPVAPLEASSAAAGGSAPSAAGN